MFWADMPVAVPWPSSLGGSSSRAAEAHWFRDDCSRVARPCRRTRSRPRRPSALALLVGGSMGARMVPLRLGRPDRPGRGPSEGGQRCTEDLAEVSIPCRNLKPHPLEAEIVPSALTLAPRLVSRRNASRSDLPLVGLGRSTSRRLRLNRSDQWKAGRLAVHLERLYSISIHAWVAWFKELECQLRHAGRACSRAAPRASPQNASCLPF